MELRQFKYFIAVAEQRNFTRAARQLGIAQPPLSVQIRKLEQELGFALFHRQPRQIVLTPAGRVFLAEARAVLTRHDAAVLAAQDAAHGRTGRLLLAHTPGAFSERVTRRLRKFLRKNRGLRLVTRDVELEPRRDRAVEPEDALLADFREDALPAGAVILETGAPVVSLPPKHRLAEKSSLALADLLGESLLVAPFEYRPPAENLLLDRLAILGHSAATESSPSRQTRWWQASLGLGCAIGTTLDRDTLDVHFRKLTDDLPRIVTALVPRADSPAAALPALIEAIREEPAPARPPEAPDPPA